jgi:hypothetical protein
VNSLFSLALGLSLLVFMQEDNNTTALESAPTPVLPAPSIQFDWDPVKLDQFSFGLSFSGDFYMTNYKWSSANERPIPAEIENRSARIIGPILGLGVQVRYWPWNRVGFMLYGGVSGDMRIVVRAADLNEADMADANEQTSKIKDYYWSNGRWFYPYFGGGAELQVTNNWAVRVDMRTWVPAMQRRSGDPAKNEWRLGFGFRVVRRFVLRAPITPSEPAPETPDTAAP